MNQTLAQKKQSAIAHAAAPHQILNPTHGVKVIEDASALTVIDLLGERTSTLVVQNPPADLTIKIDGDNFDGQGANDFKIINGGGAVASKITLNFVYKNEVKDLVVFSMPAAKSTAVSVTVTNFPSADTDATPYLLCTELFRGLGTSAPRA